LSGSSGTNITATFQCEATAAMAGQQFEILFSAASGTVTNTARWTIYVPSALEQKITFGEFHANAPGTNVTPYANFLNRPGQPPAPSSDDEWVELVNLSPEAVDLAGWTIADSVQMRHKFYDTFNIGSSNAVVVYGGPLNGFAPQLTVPVIPASENAFGFGLNNSGGDSLILRNAAGRLVSRVVYSTLPAAATMTRHPDMNGDFVSQLSVSTNAATPGLQFNGAPYSEPAVIPPAAIRLSAVRDAAAVIRLRWNAESGRTYTVQQASVVGGPYTTVATGLGFATTTAEYSDTTPASTARFFRVSTP
jgi:hypothetical protein